MAERAERQALQQWLLEYEDATGDRLSERLEEFRLSPDPGVKELAERLDFYLLHEGCEHSFAERWTYAENARLWLEGDEETISPRIVKGKLERMDWGVWVVTLAWLAGLVALWVWGASWWLLLIAVAAGFWLQSLWVVRFRTRLLAEAVARRDCVDRFHPFLGAATRNQALADHPGFSVRPPPPAPKSKGGVGRSLPALVVLIVLSPLIFVLNLCGTTSVHFWKVKN